MLLAVATFVDWSRPKRLSAQRSCFLRQKDMEALVASDELCVLKSGKRHFRSGAVVTVCDNLHSPLK